MLGTKLNAQNNKMNKRNKALALADLMVKRDQIWEFC